MRERDGEEMGEIPKMRIVHVPSFTSFSDKLFFSKIEKQKEEEFAPSIIPNLRDLVSHDESC